MILLGDYIWHNDDGFEYWGPPVGFTGAIDLASPAESQAATPGQPRWGGLFLCPSIPAGWDGDVLSSEDIRDTRPNRNMLDAWESRTGYRPQGDTLADCLVDHLTNGADPAGLDRCKPLVPTHRRVLEVWLGTRIYARSFRFSRDPHANMLADLLRRDLTRIRNEVLAGKVPANCHRRYATWLCEKYRIGFESIRPATWPANEFPLPHSTKITESFNTADSTTLGPDLTWTETLGDSEVFSNQCRQADTTNTCMNRADVDLAGLDQYCKFDVHVRGDGAQRIGACTRKDGTATDTMYQAQLRVAADQCGTFKTVNGTGTQLGANTNVTVSLPDLLEGRTTGSTVAVYYNGVFVVAGTDTEITTGLRTGIRLGSSTTTKKIVDTFEAGDLPGPPRPLRRRNRALTRM